MALVSFLFGLLLTCHVPSAQVRATVWVRAGDRANGTGWVVDAGRQWAITARHVVADRDTVEVYFLDQALAGPITDRRHYIADRADLQRRGLTATGRVIRRSDNADLALLELDRLPAGVPDLPLATESARPGDDCRSVGHRHDAELLWTLTAGRVRQIGRLPEGYFWAGRRIGAGVSLVVLQAPIAAGESGAAVVNDSGRVVGLVSAVVNQTPGSAIAIDVSEVRSMLADARGTPAPPPRSTDTATRPDAQALAAGAVWIRPRATNGRAAGVLVDADRRLVLTSATAVGSEPVVEVVAPRWYLGRLVPEANTYRDLLGFRLSGHCVSGVVLARDLDRDLALIELDSVPPDLSPVGIASTTPRMGDPVACMSHPTGIDLLWMYSAGTVRSIGSVSMGRDSSESAKVRAELLQLPQQEGASGAPVVNASGQLVGIVAARGAARQDLAYAAVPEEVRAFLKTARPLFDPRTSAEWTARGQLMSRLGRHTAALEAYRKAGELAPDDPAVAANSAIALTEIGRREEALRLAEAALNRKPAPPTLAELAEVYLRNGQRTRAAELVDRALKLDPRTAAAFVIRARLSTRQDAMDAIAEALQIDPGLIAAYRIRAGLRDQTTNEGRREAISDWGRVLELSPTNLEALRDRARLFAAVKEPKKAVGDWTRRVELDALNPENWIGLARASFAAGDRSGAAESLRGAVRVDSTRAGEAFGVVRELARELEEDNPADRERIAEWRSLALTRLAALLPE
jgi:S1-C subfamily serine protease/regulator of sirC expression with transglutaminase-like and TPR domain